MALTRVIHVITTSRIAGGMEAFLARLAPALGRSGLPQLVIARPGGDLSRRLRAEGVETLTYSLYKRRPLSSWGVKRTFRRFAPDVALSWLPCAAQQMPPGPWVHVAQVGWYRGLDCYERAERMVMPTPDMKRHFAERGFTGEITVLPHFAVPEHAPPVSRSLFATPEGVPIILALGRFDPIKGFDIALRALARLPGAYFWLGGEGEEEPALHALAAELGVAERVRFLGWRRDVTALLGQARVAIVPSRIEPLGLVTLEAWAAGVPVVAAASPGPRYAIEAEASGLLVPVEDPEALANAIRRVLEDEALARRLAEGGKRRLAERFSEEATVAAYRDYFDRVARERGRGRSAASY